MERRGPVSGAMQYRRFDATVPGEPANQRFQELLAGEPAGNGATCDS